MGRRTSRRPIRHFGRSAGQGFERISNSVAEAAAASLVGPEWPGTARQSGPARSGQSGPSGKGGSQSHVRESNSGWFLAPEHGYGSRVLVTGRGNTAGPWAGRRGPGSSDRQSGPPQPREQGRRPLGGSPRTARRGRRAVGQRRESKSCSGVKLGLVFGSRTWLWLPGSCDGAGEHRRPLGGSPRTRLQ